MLFEDFNALVRISGPDVFKSKVSDDLFSNLNANLSLREYQKEAIGRFIFYLREYKERSWPSHLLFHMATGSGKTLIMAADILLLYKLGYRNFLFFVNSTNIIEKTKDNFLNKFSSKYLFAQKVLIDGKEVIIKEVSNFSNESDDINILFTTIQGLHSRFVNPSENSITLDDFKSSKVVLISDEAHHINTLTKIKKISQTSLFDQAEKQMKVGGLTKEEVEEVRSWESTVQKIFQKSPDNILLEYTATIDLYDPNISKKYEDKILFQYDLKQFRVDGYSKEIEVLQADLDPLDRALQAIITSQYRRKVAEKNKVFLKPVILFKSKTIEESQEFVTEFQNKVKSLKPSQLTKFSSGHKTILNKAFEYFQQQDISLADLVNEIKIDFEESKCLSVNSKEDSEAKQLLVNSLEDKNNPIRAIFAVDMLNEGWDVLNLFDIVRLYETRDSKSNRPGRTTMAEAQLIGRGARYYPFTINDDPRDKRKFDNDATNEIRILEQLYYHTSHNPKYIQEIKTALIQTGIIPAHPKELLLQIKEEFKKSGIWKAAKIYLNKKVRTSRDQIDSFKKAQVETRYQHSLYTGEIEEEELLKNKFELKPQSGTSGKIEIAFSSLGDNVLRTAMNRISFYTFNNLSKHFPKLRSSRNFIGDAGFLKSIEVVLWGNVNELNQLSGKQKLDIAIKVLQKISKQIESHSHEFKGTKEFYPHPVNIIFRDKQLKMDLDSDKAKGLGETLDLSSKGWFAHNDMYGTSEENALVGFINDATDNLYKKYPEIALLRNERYFSIYSFEDGKAFEPDFVLFLKKSEQSKILIYQVLIEPKGDQFKDDKGGFERSKEGWKQKFLLDIESKHQINTLFENTDYKLLGLPFFNQRVVKQFDTAFKEKVLA